MQRIHRSALAACVLLGLTSAAASSNPAAVPSEYLAGSQQVAVAEQVQAILDDFKQARQDFGKLYSKASTEAERIAVVEEHYPEASVYCARLMKAIAADPADSGAAKGLTWVLQQSDDAVQKQAAADQLLAHHVDSEDIAGACGAYEQEVAGGRAFLEAVAERSSNPAIVAQAKYSLGMHLLQRASVAKMLEGKVGVDRQGFIDFYGEDACAGLMEEDQVDLKLEAIELLEHVAEVAAEVEYRGDTFGAACARELYELRNLEVGVVAPDITGQDLDGVDFALSDYRGKVVVLDFWGNW